MDIDKEIKEEVKELVVLIKMTEKYETVVANGFMPIDSKSISYNDKRLNRIKELFRKYDVDLLCKQN